MTKVLRNTIALSTGNIISRVVSFISALVIISKIGQNAYGEYVVVLNFLSILAPITVLGLDLVLTKKYAKSFELISLFQPSVLVVRLGLAITYFFIGLVGAAFFLDDKSFGLALGLLPVILMGGLLPCGLCEHLNTVLRSQQKMVPVAVLMLLRSVLLLVLIISVATFYQLDITTYLFILNISSLIYLAFCIIVYYKEGFKLGNIKAKKNILKEFVPESVRLGLAGFFITGANLADIFILKYFCPLSWIASYAIVVSIMSFANYFVSSYQQSLYADRASRDNSLPAGRNIWYSAMASTFIGFIANHFLRGSGFLSGFFLDCSNHLDYLIWMPIVRLTLVRYDIIIDLSSLFKKRILGAIIKSGTFVILAFIFQGLEVGLELYSSLVVIASFSTLIYYKISLR